MANKNIWSSKKRRGRKKDVSNKSEMPSNALLPARTSQPAVKVIPPTALDVRIKSEPMDDRNSVSTKNVNIVENDVSPSKIARKCADQECVLNIIPTDIVIKQEPVDDYETLSNISFSHTNANEKTSPSSKKTAEDNSLAKTVTAENNSPSKSERHQPIIPNIHIKTEPVTDHESVSIENLNVNNFNGVNPSPASKKYIDSEPVLNSTNQHNSQSASESEISQTLSSTYTDIVKNIVIKQEPVDDYETHSNIPVSHSNVNEETSPLNKKSSKVNSLAETITTENTTTPKYESERQYQPAIPNIRIKTEPVTDHESISIGNFNLNDCNGVNSSPASKKCIDSQYVPEGEISQTLSSTHIVQNIVIKQEPMDDYETHSNIHFSNRNVSVETSPSSKKFTEVNSPIKTFTTENNYTSKNETVDMEIELSDDYESNSNSRSHIKIQHASAFQRVSNNKISAEEIEESVEKKMKTVLISENNHSLESETSTKEVSVQDKNFSTDLLKYFNLNTEIRVKDIKECSMYLNKHFVQKDRFRLFYRDDVEKNNGKSLKTNCSQEKGVQPAENTVCQIAPLGETCSPPLENISSSDTDASKLGLSLKTLQDILQTFNSPLQQNVNSLKSMPLNVRTATPPSNDTNKNQMVTIDGKSPLFNFAVEQIKKRVKIEPPDIFENSTTDDRQERFSKDQQIKSLPFEVMATLQSASNFLNSKKGSLEEDNKFHSTPSHSYASDPNEQKSQRVPVVSRFLKSTVSGENNNEYANRNIGSKDNLHIHMERTSSNDSSNAIQATARRMSTNADNLNCTIQNVSDLDEISTQDLRDPRIRKIHLNQMLPKNLNSNHMLNQPQNNSRSVAKGSNNSSVPSSFSYGTSTSVTPNQNIRNEDRGIFTPRQSLNVSPNVKPTNPPSLAESSTASVAFRDPRLALSENATPPCTFSNRKVNESSSFKSLHKKVGKEFITDGFLTLVLEWNPSWLLTQERLRKYAPICDSYPIVRNVYENHLQYYNTYLPLHLFSIWLRINDAWRRSPPYIETYCAGQQIESNYVKIICYVFLRDNDKWPKREDIVLCRASYDGKNFEEFFGCVRSVMSKDHFSEKGRLSKVKIEIHCTEMIDMRGTNTVVKMQILFNIRISLLQNDALRSLNDNIKYLILDPTSHRYRAEIVDYPPNIEIKALRDKVLQAISRLDTRLVLIDTSNPCDAVLLITQVAFSLMKNLSSVLIFMKNEESFRKLVKRLMPYNPILAVRTKEIELSDEYMNFTLEYHLRHKKTVDIFKNCRIFITAFSAFSFDTFQCIKQKILKQQKFTCIIDDADLCTEAETALPLTYNIEKLVLLGNPNREALMPSILKQHGYGLSLFKRFYCKK